MASQVWWLIPIIQLLWRLRQGVLVTFVSAETKYLMTKMKEGKVYIAYSLYRFQSVLSWLCGRVAWLRGSRSWQLWQMPKVARQKRQKG